MKLRIATFNLENLDDVPGKLPTLAERIAVLGPHLDRLNADIICLQEIHGQEVANQPRQLLALKKLLDATRYKNYKIESTKTKKNEVYDKRNLVVVYKEGYTLLGSQQINNDKIPAPQYRKATSEPPEDSAKNIGWERPIFYVKLKVREGFEIHLITLHLKSRKPVDIKGQIIQKITPSGKTYEIWKTSSGWAEGFFISSIKRVGQALETRVLIDEIFDADKGAKIVICGDFNAHPGEVPVEAICGRIENTDNPNLIEQVMISCEETVSDSKRYTYLYHGQKNLLDHMLISRTMLPYYRNTEIHNETLHDETLAFALDTKFPESDHAPFVAEFEIP